MTNAQNDKAILFADVSGSTRLYDKLGDTEALHAVDRCLNRMRRAVEAFSGRVVKTIGDEVMAVFPNAVEATQAACEMQLRIEDLPPVSGVKLAIRVGFHFGAVIEENDDYFGDTVNVAARMVGLAKSGQILTTAEAVAEYPPIMKDAVREIDRLPIKGKADELSVFEVIWQEHSDLTMKASPIPRNAMPPRLHLRYRDADYVMDVGRDTLAMGRGVQNNDIVVRDQRASRQHCRIERRRDKFVLIDQSTNGTFLTVSGEPEVVLKREEAILRQHGQIGFGHSATEDGVELMSYEIVAG